MAVVVAVVAVVAVVDAAIVVIVLVVVVVVVTNRFNGRVLQILFYCLLHCRYQKP
jgi:hypothetical protein